ncbi:MAG TPA: tRNA (uridine(34)/cytosine(34)/5-carboxymethylaminomethyluridine(34)-2'-O)-methyltransferase TrmL [Spirochaetia bacterium]|nr:tRNA (uridine(34)/cytosine(34)/5-carboxymethylaminomethyluridine(34)-2'-O)-methyltransferase TrmL [Spirochaetia bacterium]
MLIHVALHEPEIPQNTGNIARTCAAVGARLHLIHPLGFSTADRYLKRAGLDYWELVEVVHHESLEAFQEMFRGRQILYASTKGSVCYADVRYEEECCLVFGKETAGLPEPVLRLNREHCIRIPMRSEARSLNLSNAAAIVVFEALRQNSFRGLNVSGIL